MFVKFLRECLYKVIFLSAKLSMLGLVKVKLALIQTRLVVGDLQKYYPNTEFVVKTLDTVGDNILDKPLSQIGEKSLFTRELEDELLLGNVDIVVHSLKDLPTKLPENCCIGGITCREDPTDSIVFRSGYKPESIDALGRSVFGTSSLRRISQLKSKFPGVRVKDVRGNINTRLSKLDDHKTHGFDCLVLAAAGLKRSELSERISHRLEWFHAVSQGALGIECRSDDKFVIEHLLKPLRDPRTTLECLAERAFLCYLEGGCSVPIGVQTSWSNETSLTLQGIVLSLDGSQKFESTKTIDLDYSRQESDISRKYFTDIEIHTFPSELNNRVSNSVVLGIELAKDLIELGVKSVLDQIKL